MAVRLHKHTNPDWPPCGSAYVDASGTRRLTVIGLIGTKPLFLQTCFICL